MSKANHAASWHVMNPAITNQRPPYIPGWSDLQIDALLGAEATEYQTEAETVRTHTVGPVKSMLRSVALSLLHHETVEGQTLCCR